MKPFDYHELYVKKKYFDFIRLIAYIYNQRN